MLATTPQPRTIHAQLWSLIASYERQGIDPQRYLTGVLAKIGRTLREKLKQFLPDIWKADGAVDLTQ